MMKFLSSQKFLAIYSGVLTLAFAVVVLTGATQIASRKTKYEEIDVQRINLVEPDGTLRMVISDSARAPGAIVKGKEYPHPDGRSAAGMIFFNDEGSENGGLIFGGDKDKTGKVSSHGHLSFDNYDQDQVMVIEGNQDDTDRKSAYLSVWDRPDYPLSDLLELLQKNKDLPKDQQQALIEKFVNERPKAQQRLLLGRRQDRSVGLNLKDTEGRDRIVIKVAADGTPTLQFLDSDGKVSDQFPPDKH